MLVVKESTFLRWRLVLWREFSWSTGLGSLLGILRFGRLVEMDSGITNSSHWAFFFHRDQPPPVDGWSPGKNGGLSKGIPPK